MNINDYEPAYKIVFASLFGVLAYSFFKHTQLILLSILTAIYFTYDLSQFYPDKSFTTLNIILSFGYCLAGSLGFIFICYAINSLFTRDHAVIKAGFQAYKNLFYKLLRNPISILSEYRKELKLFIGDLRKLLLK